MSALASLFVGKPAHILAIAVVLLAVHFLMRRRPVYAARKRGPLLIAAAGWALYAGWEFLVDTATPDADIRVDLLVIWPLLGLLTLWAVVRSFV